MNKLVDTKGRIARAKAHMPAQSSVRRSKFCDEIISLRLQGYSYRKIEDWLREKGLEAVIPAATLCRNLQRGFGAGQEFLPAYEEIAESNGGDIALDPARTLAGQALIQRMRIDYMVRQENERRKVRVGYSNPRIRQEMETYLQIVQAAATFKAEETKGEGEITNGNASLSQEAEDQLANLILDGKITLPGVGGGRPTLTVVGKTA